MAGKPTRWLELAIFIGISSSYAGNILYLFNIDPAVVKRSNGKSPINEGFYG